MKKNDGIKWNTKDNLLKIKSKFSLIHILPNTQISKNKQTPGDKTPNSGNSNSLLLLSRPSKFQEIKELVNQRANEQKLQEKIETAEINQAKMLTRTESISSKADLSNTVHSTSHSGTLRYWDSWTN